jgi:drug/metabolite transporter (DMT)-like permease
MKPNKQLALLLGITSSLFFAITFVVNRLMALNGGSWIWSASLRFFWMLPVFLIVVLARKKYKPLIIEIKDKPFQWLLWSTIGFGFFYACLTFAAAYSPSWLVASTWQITIVAGLLLAPIINPNLKNINAKSLLFSGIIVLGIIVMQINQIQKSNLNDILQGFMPILIAAFAYPLGNRKLMLITEGKLDVYQRILGMLLCSMPFWIILSILELANNHSFPQKEQVFQTLIVAVFSGVIATILFFKATDLVSNNENYLSTIEATQSLEVLFALLGEMLFLSLSFPNNLELIGIAFVIIGMILHSIKK